MNHIIFNIMFFSLIFSANKIITIITKVIKSFLRGNEIRISSRMRESFFQVFHLSLIGKAQSILIGRFILREMAYNVTERIRAAAWRGLSGTHDRFTSSRKTILISTHSTPRSTTRPRARNRRFKLIRFVFPRLDIP